jgi:hypothetical protein
MLKQWQALQLVVAVSDGETTPEISPGVFMI